MDITTAGQKNNLIGLELWMVACVSVGFLACRFQDEPAVQKKRPGRRDPVYYRDGNNFPFAPREGHSRQFTRRKEAWLKIVLSGKVELTEDGSALAS